MCMYAYGCYAHVGTNIVQCSPNYQQGGLQALTAKRCSKLISDASMAECRIENTFDALTDYARTNPHLHP